MKKLRFNKISWQSFLSAIIFGVFIFFGLASLPSWFDEFAGINPNLSYLGDGYYEENIDFKYFARGKKMIRDSGKVKRLFGKEMEPMFFTQKR